MRIPCPISEKEFSALFRICKPPFGWPTRLAVANSGGPDSICLLFLLNRLLSASSGAKVDLPLSLVSLTVDHRLQAVSSRMAEHCAKIAGSLDVEHLTTAITWSEPPFPPKPSQAFESIARDARYHVVFHAMTRVGAGAIAFGHHADDQIETALLRLTRGSTEIGLAGMRPCRRWGMGFGNGEGSLGWAGYEGMQRWIVRPLLQVPKDRILATCEANGLEYVTDPTNFQPEITLRNAIRQMLSAQEGTTGDGHFSASNVTSSTKSQVLLSSSQAIGVNTSDGVADRLGRIVQAAQTFQSVSLDISQGKAHLRKAISTLSRRVQHIDQLVTDHLERCVVRSPPSTLLLSSSQISSITDNAIRLAMVLRVLRYVSFHPWGSIRSEAHRRAESLQQIVDKVWSSSETSRMFVAGGGVLWTPVLISNEGEIKMIPPNSKLSAQPRYRDGFERGWIASRQPPYSNLSPDTRTDPLHVDITHAARRCQSEYWNGDEDSAIQLLWDCRFLLRIKAQKVFGAIGRADAETCIGKTRIIIEPETKWYLPRVVWQREDGCTVLARLCGPWNKEKNTTQDLATIESVRTLGAI